MTLKQFVLPFTVAIALAAGTVPAYAQRHGDGHGGGHWSGRSVERGHAPGRVGHARVVPGRPAFRGYRGPFVRTHVIRPFHSSFYVFRPHFSLGFGLFLGYPVAYPWDYVELYGYPYAYPWVVPGDADAVPPPPTSDQSADLMASRDVGGISLDISPSDATVSVDGMYAGIVGDFSPSSAPLTLVPGAHHLVIAKPGYHSMTFDATIAAGQVLPYQGRMERS